MTATSIEWTEKVWNPTRGCSRVSEGCRNCYAERVAARFVKPGQPFHGFAKVTAPRDSLDRIGGRRNGWTGRVELVPEKLAEPLRWRRPSRVFVNSMSDLFHEALPDEAIDEVVAIMSLTPHLDYQVLTKRAERMRAYWCGPWQARLIPHLHRWQTRPPGHGVSLSTRNGVLPNVWLGVSVEDQASADARIPHLLATPAAVRFVSAEPLLGPVDIGPFLGLDELVKRCPSCRYFTNRSGECDCPNGCGRLDRDVRVDWVIVGGESGPAARPCDVAWIRGVVEQCRAAGVPVFVKQLGARPVWDRNFDGGAISRGTRESIRATLRFAWHAEEAIDQAMSSAESLPSLRLVDRKGGDPSEWPADLRVREFPAGAKA